MWLYQNSPGDVDINFEISRVDGARVDGAREQFCPQ